MFKSPILDTLIFKSQKIVFKHLHALRTVEAFKFLSVECEPSEIEKCYDVIETKYAKRLHPDECLRIIFSQSVPLNYHVEIQKIEKLNEIIKLNPVQLNEPPGPEAAYKWENRKVWSELLKEKKPEADDILVINSQYELIETSRFNIFYYDDKRAKVYTPDLKVGCLNGVFRRFSLENESLKLPDLGTKKLSEKNITLDELSYYPLYVGNSVRGIIKATLI